jgi:hypothetical protein
MDGPTTATAIWSRLGSWQFGIRELPCRGALRVAVFWHAEAVSSDKDYLISTACASSYERDVASPLTTTVRLEASAARFRNAHPSASTRREARDLTPSRGREIVTSE